MLEYDSLEHGWIVATLLDYIKSHSPTTQDYDDKERVKQVLRRFLSRIQP